MVRAKPLIASLPGGSRADITPSRANNLLAHRRTTGDEEAQGGRAAARHRASAPDGARRRGRAARSSSGSRSGAAAAAPTAARIRRPRPGTAADGSEAEAKKVSEGLPLSQQVGRLVVLRFAGTSEPGYVRRVLADGRAAGAILFRDNLTGPTRRRRWRAAAAAARRAPPLIMVDQEGGDIRILPWAPPARSQPRRPRRARSARTPRRPRGRCAPATSTSRSRRSATWRASRAPRSPARAFSTDFQAAAKAMAEAVRGWRAGGVAPTAKHFPGLGGATVEHRRRARDDRPPAEQIRGARPGAVQGGDRGRRPARDGRARALPGARRRADRLAVASRSSRACCATSSASTAS